MRIYKKYIWITGICLLLTGIFVWKHTESPETPAAADYDPVMVIRQINDQAENTADSCIYMHSVWQAGEDIISVTARDSKLGVSLSDVEIQIKTGSGKLIKKQINECDPVKNIWITDLDHNAKPEIILCSVCAGSGAYGDVIIYQWDGHNLNTLNLPVLTGSADGKDYMGHDRFWIENNCLIREFVLYHKDDANADATNGQRRITYTLKNSKWHSTSRDFFIKKVQGLIRRTKNKLD